MVRGSIFLVEASAVGEFVSLLDSYLGFYMLSSFKACANLEVFADDNIHFSWLVICFEIIVGNGEHVG